MARKDFGQYCGLARALELVGERWALLIVRELLARPSRYTELLDDLPGIPTNVLSTRLKELEAAGVVERRVAPAPQRGVVYALTADGEALQPAILTLARWGNGHLGEQRPDEFVPSSTIAVALRAMFKAEEAGDLAAAWEIHVAGVVLAVVVGEGQVTSGIGPAAREPDLIMTIRADKMPTFQAIMLAITAGQAEMTGRQELVGPFLRIFAPAGLLKTAGQL